MKSTEDVSEFSQQLPDGCSEATDTKHRKCRCPTDTSESFPSNHNRTVFSITSLRFQNTFVLKRRTPPTLAKKGTKVKNLRNRHFIYELVEYRANQKRPNLQVVLTAFVEGVGDKGDIVEMRPAKAYNNFLLTGLAVYNTPENRAKYEKTEVEKQVVTHSSPHAARTVNVLESRVYAIIMNKNNPWILEPWHIRVALRKAGINALEECIELPKTPITGPDLDKQNKEFIVTVTVNNVEKARVRCRIHHWSNEPSDRLPYVYEHWKLPAEPLLPDLQT